MGKWRPHVDVSGAPTHRSNPHTHSYTHTHTQHQHQTQQNVTRLRERGGVSWLLKALKTDRDKG